MIPKFRFFGKVNDGTTHMVLAESIDFKNGFIYYNYHDYTVEGGDHVYGDVIGFEDCVLMQSTGLFDANGKEIFEGDVASFGDASDNENVFVNKGVVEICQLGWHFSNRVSVDMEDLLDGHVLDCEIIGNIYENPELVEAEND
ncbi:YopX family protein [Streptococcus suis]